MNINALIRQVWRQKRHAPRVTYARVDGAPNLYIPTHGVVLTATWDVVTRFTNGEVKDAETGSNLIVNEMLDKLLEQGWRNDTAISQWYCGLTTGTTTPAAGDTMGSHPGWTEWQTYSEGTRPAYNPAAPSSQSIGNPSPITFTSSGDGQSVDGGFITSSPVKGGVSGTLSNVKAFALAKTLDTSETIDVTVLISASSS